MRKLLSKLVKALNWNMVLMANSQVDVNVIQPLKSKSIEARKVTVKGRNGLYSASCCREAQWGVSRNGDTPWCETFKASLMFHP